MPDPKKSASAGGDAPHKQEEKKPTERSSPENDVDVITRTASKIEKDEAEHRAMLRRQRFKRQWPEIYKPPIKTKPWHPPGPPLKMPRIEIALPQLETRQWVPPYRRRRRMRPRLPRIPPEQMTQPLYECSTLKKIWHAFSQVEKNKMILQGTIACNSKAYSSVTCGAQTACIAVCCRAVLDDKTPAELTKRDVNTIIEAGDRYWKQSMLAMKCYKGKPQLELNQLLTSFFVNDTKYSIKLSQIEKGVLAKHPDNVDYDLGLIELMDKRVGGTFMFILSVGTKKHFLIFGHPPDSGSMVKTICYIFDPHMLDDMGIPNKLYGAGAFLRYAGISSFLMDFLSYYGDLDAVKRGARTPTVTLTNVEVLQKELLNRDATFELDLKTLKIHCKSEWDSIHMNALIEQKQKAGKYPLASLSAVSLATSRATLKHKVRAFYQKLPKETMPTLPFAPERAPPSPTTDQLMQMRGEDFFLNCPRSDGYTYGRDDLIPLPDQEPILHSPVEKADKTFKSQYQQVDGGKWILRATRHMGSYRYQTFRFYTAIACCVAALALLRRMRARSWNEDTLDETLDLGYNLYRESLLERTGPIRRLVLGELKESFIIRDKDYIHKDKGITVWGKLLSGSPKVFDICRGIDAFFKESDAGILQIPGEYEVAIWKEGGRYYVYHPWPADRYGKRVGLRDGGKACLLYFTTTSRLCEHLLECCADMRKKPFSISDVVIRERGHMPEQINKLKPVALNRWVMRGNFSEGDERFPEEHRNKQATPNAICAIAMSHVIPTTEWTSNDIDEVLMRGDILYQETMENLEKRGVSLEPSKNETEEAVGEEEQEKDSGGKLGAHDVLNRFMISEFESIETDVYDGLGGSIKPEPGDGLISLKDSINQLFKQYSHAVVTARGVSTAIWLNKDDGCYYYFDSHGCDEEGFVSADPRAAACLVRVKGNAGELSDVILANLPSGADNSFNICPVAVSVTRLNTELGAPETTLENKQFEWMAKKTAAILMGPRGENTAIGKAAEKAGVPKDDMSGRTIALPAAAAFAAASEAVPPPHMHQDHMFNFLDAGSEYYLNHVKRTGNKEITPEDLTEKFEMGANTFSIQLGEPVRLPLRLPDEPTGEGGEEEAADEEEVGEEEEEKEIPMKQMKDILFRKWYDKTEPTSISLLIGDYHQMGVWMAAGGKVVVFDPAPTLLKGKLTPQRIKKGDELRLQRLKDEMTGEGGDEAGEEEEEAGAEGEEQPEPEPESVPPESCPALMVFSSPGEFIDRLTLNGGLDRKQCLAPYKLYPVKITNELTSVLKEKMPRVSGGGEEAADEEAEDALVEPLNDEAIGKYFNRVSRTTASLRGNLAQDENYFMDEPNRNHQDAATAIMGIVVENIQPYTEWKPSLIDAIIKYGDRLYTMSLPNAKLPPYISPDEVQKEFHVTNFNVRLEVEPNAVTGDIKAGNSGNVLNLRRGLESFFGSYKYGVLCAKNYCVGLWRSADESAYCLWEPHSCGPTGLQRPGGAAGITVYSNVQLLVDVMKSSITGPGGSGFSISPVKVFWEISQMLNKVTAQGNVPEDGYEWKVLTAFVQTAKGRTILRGTRATDVTKFTRDALMQSACGAIVSVCMSHIRRPHLWTRRTVDEVMSVACQLFTASVGSLGYEFRPGDDVLMPLQVLKRFVLGINYVKYDLDSVYTGRLEQIEPTGLTLKSALEQFFELYTHGVIWCKTVAVGVWKNAGAPAFYMMEPQACGVTGLRTDAQENAAACVLTFTSAKLMAFAYLENIPLIERPKLEFSIYAMSVTIRPIKPMPIEPPLVRAISAKPLVPATSHVDTVGRKRHADEKSRKHPPGGPTCGDASRALMAADKDESRLKGLRNTSGWLVLADGTQFLSAQHSIACKKFPHGSRTRQALTCSIMAVAMSRVEDVCRWCSSTLDQILESGDQLYQDSYLHFKPSSRLLKVEQVLRKFYTPGNCVCRVTIYSPRQAGVVNENLLDMLMQFFSEEKSGVLVAGKGDFAIALFKTPRGFYMFDPADRDRYGRAVAPPCIGHARACFSQYPSVVSLCQKLAPNIPPTLKEATENDKEDLVKDVMGVDKPNEEKEVKDVMGVDKTNEEKELRFEEPAKFLIYGMEVTSLRRLNKHER